MRIRNRVGLAALVLLSLFVLLRAAPANSGVETGDEVTLTLVGRVVNTQGTAVDEAEVRVFVSDEETQVAHIGADGFYVVELTLSQALIEAEAVAVEISKPGFRTTRQGLARQEMACTSDRCHVRVPDVVLLRIFNVAFFIATLTFVAVFVLIAFHVLHDTLAAFLGATVMLGISYAIGTFNPDFWILGFEQAVGFIDFDVIFLIMTLMIVVSIIGRTGVFQWLALAAYRAARGSAWRLAVILMAATAVMSAMLNNVTIMLLMAPITF